MLDLFPTDSDTQIGQFGCFIPFEVMSKKSRFTTVTPLPAGITRETVLETLHNHVEMIDLNPLVTERHPIKPPSEATAEEYHCQWYSITDKVNYLPGGLYSGSVTFNACFHDLPDGLQSHIYAPMGLDMKGRWTLGGSLPGEPRQAVEIGLGLPKTGLWLREDVEMRVIVVLCEEDDEEGTWDLGPKTRRESPSHRSRSPQRRPCRAEVSRLLSTRLPSWRDFTSRWNLIPRRNFNAVREWTLLRQSERGERWVS